MDEEFIVSTAKSMKNLIKQKDSPIKKVLRKKSIVHQNWKEVLELARIQKNRQEEKQGKHKFLRDILKNFCLLFKKRNNEKH